MTELWIISGRDPVNWTFPFYVDPAGNRLLISCAVNLLGRQRFAVEHLLSQHAERFEMKWAIKPGVLNEIGQRTKGTDPEAYVIWSAPRPESIRVNPDINNRMDFAASMFQSGIGETPQHAQTIWVEICRLIADRLINKEKPVDFFFFKLHNCPYRANWLPVVTQRLKLLLTGKLNQQVAARELAGIDDALNNPELMAYDQMQETCLRRVEVEHRKKWWTLVQRVEAARLKAKGYTDYAKYFLASVRRFYPSAVAIHKAWLAQSRAACVARSEGGPDGPPRFVSATRRRELRMSSRHFCAIPTQFGSGETDSLPKAVLEEDGDLS